MGEDRRARQERQSAVHSADGSGAGDQGDGSGRAVILTILRPVACIGEMSLIDNEAHSATVPAEILTDGLGLARVKGTTARITENKHPVR